MDKNSAKHLLMKPKGEEHLQKILESIEKKPRPITLSPKGLEKAVNKLIAYEYLVNGDYVIEDTIEFLRQDIDGAWIFYSTKAKEKNYAKVWFTSTNPDLRQIFNEER